MQKHNPDISNSRIHVNSNSFSFILSIHFIEWLSIFFLSVHFSRHSCIASLFIYRLQIYIRSIRSRRKKSLSRSVLDEESKSEKSPLFIHIRDEWNEWAPLVREGAAFNKLNENRMDEKIFPMRYFLFAFFCCHTLYTD
jgi:hypothetical protein